MPKRTWLSVLAVLLICSFATTAYAIGGTDAQLIDNYNYQLTSNYPSTVPIGTSVTVTATTDNNVVTTVFFTWTNPANQNPINNESVSVSNGDSINTGSVSASNGVSFSTYTLDALGNWTVAAIFVGPGVEKSVTITMTVENINVIPEVPILGTAGALIAMIIGLVYMMKRKPTKKTTKAKDAASNFLWNDTLDSFSE
jgi:hypothetical protein